MRLPARPSSSDGSDRIGASDHRRIRAAHFRSDPADPTRLQKLGPWPIPDDPDEEQVIATVLAAVASVDGDDARERVHFADRK